MQSFPSHSISAFQFSKLLYSVLFSISKCILSPTSSNKLHIIDRPHISPFQYINHPPCVPTKSPHIVADAILTNDSLHSPLTRSLHVFSNKIGFITMCGHWRLIHPPNRSLLVCRLNYRNNEVCATLLNHSISI